jgi:hypothetical protein
VLKQCCGSLANLAEAINRYTNGQVCCKDICETARIVSEA